MKPLKVWTCQRVENLKKKSLKIPKNKYAATMVSAARRQIIGGGGAPINKSQRRRRPQIVGGGGAARPAHGSSPKYLTQNCLTLIRQKNWSRLSCRANIRPIRIDRRNLLKLINKHLGKHSKFIHKFVSLHYYYLIVTFLYYQKCAKTHLHQCINFNKFRGRTL